MNFSPTSENIMFAIRNNDVAMLKRVMMLTSTNTRAPDTQGHNIWWLALQSVHNGAPECLKLLISCGVSPHTALATGERLVEIASKNHPGCLRVLLDADASPYCSLLVATVENAPICLQMLISAGADLEVRGGDNCTALSMALQSPFPSCFSMIRSLLRAGAEIEYIGSRRIPHAIDIAGRFGDVRVTELVEAERRKRTPAYLPGPLQELCGDLGLPTAVAREILKWV